MRYEEAVIGGVLCWRSSEEEIWQRMSAERLTQLLLERAAPVGAIRSSVQGYYRALDRREHGAVAMNAAFRSIEAALGMCWVQGASLASSNAPQ